MNNRHLIVGVGSALVDILAHREDDFLDEHGIVKGGMTLVDIGFIEAVMPHIADDHHVVCGGSACNTAQGVACLGGASRFVGKRGEDAFGDLLVRELQAAGIDPAMLISESPTGRVLSLITPDAQRSMLTYLGASSETAPGEMAPDLFEGAAIVHVEGYLVFNPALLAATLEAAKNAGALVSLDLASFTVVEESLDVFREMVEKYVDILIANEDEARAFTGLEDEEEALAKMSGQVEVAALKLGARGSLVAHDGKVHRIDPVEGGEPLDTTGAGDLWAAGFLYGFARGMPLEDCGRIASACGWEVCRVVGASIPDEGWDRIRKIL